MAEPDLADALGEIAFLRQMIEGAIVGDDIIVKQLAPAAESKDMLGWSYRQAKANADHLRRFLAVSREDFPHEGRPLPAALIG